MNIDQMWKEIKPLFDVIPEEPRRRLGRAISLLFFPLFILLLLLSCSTLSLLRFQTVQLQDTRSNLKANYGPWGYESFQAVNPAIIEEIEQDLIAQGIIEKGDLDPKYFEGLLWWIPKNASDEDIKIILANAIMLTKQPTSAVLYSVFTTPTLTSTTSQSLTSTAGSGSTSTTSQTPTASAVGTDPTTGYTFTPAATSTNTSTPTITPTHTATSTAGPTSASASSTPTFTSTPTATFTPTATTSPGGLISGIVFEDVNYAGGSGSAYGAGDQLLQNVTVELYNSSNVFLGTTNTDASGAFGFFVAADDIYTIRVVTSTIGDGDTPPANGLNAGVPIVEQTFEHNGVSGNGGAGAMGGNNSQTSDYLIAAGSVGDANVSVTVASADVPGVEFGFSYNVITNTKDSGQGSLRQYINNALAISGGSTGYFYLDTVNDPNFANPNFTFSPTSAYPTLNDGTGGIGIDGAEANGYTVVIDGTSAGAVDAFTLGTGNAILNLTIQNYTANFAVSINSTSGNTVSGNTMGSNFQGVTIEGNSATGNTISGNTVTSSGEDGIEVTTNANNNTISNNTITLSADNGLDIDGGANNNLFDNNTVSLNTNSGIEIDTGANTNTISNSTISANGSSGIYIHDSTTATNNNTIDGNTINLNTSRGIYLTGTMVYNTTVNGNSLTGNLSDGIDLSNGTYSNTLSNNTITLSGDDGIDIDTGANTITISGGSISNNIATGVDIIENISLTNNITISGVTINSNGVDGIILSGANVIGVTIDGNTINGNIDDGIEVTQSSYNHTIDNNTISGNGDDGIVINLAGYNVLIRYNTIESNGTIDATANGIRADGTGVFKILISENLIWDNPDIGIKITNSANKLNDSVSIPAPTISSVTDDGFGNLTITGTCDSGAVIEFFDVTNGGTVTADGSGAGEGPVYLGSFTEGSGDDGNGTDGSFTFVLSASGLTSGDVLTATQTDTDLETSEFATNYTIP